MSENTTRPPSSSRTWPRSVGSASVPRAVRSTEPESLARLLRTSSDAAETIRTSSEVRSFQGSRAASERDLAADLVAVRATRGDQIRVDRETHRRDRAHRDAPALEREAEVLDSSVRDPEAPGQERLPLADLRPHALELPRRADQANGTLDVVER